MHLRVARECERQALDLGSGHELAKDAAHQRHELQLAGDQHAQRSRIGPREPCVLRLHCDRERATGRPALS